MRQQKPKITQEKPINLKTAVEQISEEIKDVHRAIAELAGAMKVSNEKAATQVREFTPRKTCRIVYETELKFDAFNDDHARSIWQSLDLDAIGSEKERLKAGVGLESKLSRVMYPKAWTVR
jgi:hypothetical protein